MSSGFPPPLKVQHVDLPTQQRRLRHLSSISARWLSIQGFGGVLLDSYFTLHLPADPESVIYRSETLHSSLNPAWRSFDPETFDIEPYGHCVVVKVWCGVKGARFRLALEYHVDLAAVVYVGPHMFSAKSYNRNTLLFEMFHGYYQLPEHDNISEAVLFQSLRIPSISCEASQVQDSYSLDVLNRFHGLHMRLAASRHRSQHKVKSDILHRTHQTEGQRSLVMQQEYAQCRVNSLWAELEQRQQCLAEEQEVLKNHKEVLLARTRKREADNKLLKSAQAELADAVEHLSTRRQVCRASVRSLQLARSWLASDLLNVLPIVQISESQYTIGDIRLPPSESFGDVNERDLAVSCGYAAQVAVTFSSIFAVPLRHMILFNGSQSVIRDDIPIRVVDNERELRLYPRQRHERDDFFKVAMYLLNANILQLRQFVHLGTSDPRRTLHNIKGMLDKLAVRCHRAEASLNIARSERFPSCSFGRPLPHMRAHREREDQASVQEIMASGEHDHDLDDDVSLFSQRTDRAGSIARSEDGTPHLSATAIAVAPSPLSSPPDQRSSHSGSARLSPSAHHRNRNSDSDIENFDDGADIVPGDDDFRSRAGGIGVNALPDSDVVIVLGGTPKD